MTEREIYLRGAEEMEKSAARYRGRMRKAALATAAHLRSKAALCSEGMGG
jgi:hypothetical protein